MHVHFQKVNHKSRFSDTIHYKLSKVQLPMGNGDKADMFPRDHLLERFDSSKEHDPFSVVERLFQNFYF